MLNEQLLRQELGFNGLIVSDASAMAGMNAWADRATLVPEIINKTVADRTPGAIWHSVRDGGHFIAVSHADDILALAANDLVPKPN